MQTAVWIYDIDNFRIVWANKPALALWNSPDIKELSARNFESESSDAVTHRLRQYQKGFETGHTYQENWTITPKGQEKIALCQFSGFKLASGRMAMQVEALVDSETSIAVSQYATTMLASFSLDGNFISGNPPFTKAFGSQTLNLTTLVVATADAKQLIEGAKAHKYMERDIELHSPEGNRWYRIKVEYLQHKDRPQGLLLHLYDIHQRKMDEIALRKQAHTDPLTGLYNRRGLQQSLTNKIAHDTAFILLYIDLDGFKIINDSFGHNIGDNVLKTVVNRLQALNITNSTLCRFGGDEFICVVEGKLDAEGKQQLCGRIIDTISEPIDGLHISSLHVSASIGVVQYPEHGTDIEHLIICADAAMYKAKALGKKGWADYAEGMESNSKRTSKVARFLAFAIEKNELALHYQPIVDLDTQTVVSFEALLRWHNPTLGYVNPEEAISVAEQIGLIPDLELWVIDRALRDLKQLKSALGKHIKMNVNVSAVHFSLPGFYDNLLNLIKRHSLAYKDIAIELTESMLVQNLTDENSTLGKLVEHGIVISIDDFGTGYSSLAYLHDIPASVVKVDRSFVARSASSTLRFIQQLADSLSLTTLAEGIETQQKAELLHAIGFRLQQGYFHGKPQPLSYYLTHL